MKFKVGDIAKLKSGGPDMTVRAVFSDRETTYKCQWFAGKKLDNGIFPEDSLEAVSKDS
jgi:uncharacterized protein YodC (DUF2158 family)